MQLPAFSGHKKSINLLPKDSFESSNLGVVLTWALAFGKWTVIVTQLVVISAFLYRFILDRQVTNLRKEIDQQVAVIQSYAQMEKEFVVLQERLRFAAPAMASQAQISKYLTYIQSITPQDVTFERLNISSKTIQFSARSSSLTGFSQMLTQLQNNKDFSAVSVAKIENSTDSNNLLSFDISVNVREKKDANGK